MDNLSIDELYEYVGDISQVADIQECRLSGGRSDGVRAVNVSNGSGLEYTVLPDRGMDILSVKYKGKSLNYRSVTGVTSPKYYVEAGTEWLRSFYAGALTTCGLRYFGQPQEDQGIKMGLHGRIANTPAEDFSVSRGEIGNDYLLSLKGVMTEASAFGESLKMTRKIETKLGQKGFRLTDSVFNNGYKSEPLMMLYHFNFGFPFLNPESRILGPVVKTEGGNDNTCSSEVLKDFGRFGKPVDEYPDELFYHRLAADKNGRTFIALVNDGGNWSDGPLAVVLRFDIEQLPYFVEWKVMERQNYLVCLEPANCMMKGREQLRNEGKLPVLNGREKRDIIIDYEIIDSAAGVKMLENEVSKITS